MLIEILEQKYGLVCRSIETTKGGWMAAAYRVETEDQIYFLKVYSKKRALTAHYTRNIEAYSRVMQDLADVYGFAEYTAIPVAGLNGEYRIETEDSILWLFTWIAGVTIAESPLDDTDAARLAEVIECMHKAVDKITFPAEFPAEVFHSANTDKLRNILKDGTGIAEELIRSYAGMAEQAVEYVKRKEEIYRSESYPFVLCHTDIHSWNLMRRTADRKIMLIDFEGLKLAPAENDLGLLPQEYAQQVWDCYSLKKPDPELIEYYQLTRIIDDIVEEVEEMNVAEEEQARNEHSENLQNELRKLKNLMQQTRI